MADKTEQFELHLVELEQKINKKKTLVKNLLGDLKKSQKSLTKESDAELVRANLHKIKRGMKEVSLTDYSAEPIKERLITLDPLISPKELLEKMFNGIKKAKRGILIIEKRLAQARLELADLMAKLEETRFLGVDGFVPSPPKPQLSKQELKFEGVRKPYRVYISSDEIKIFVGRSAKDSDELTLRHSRGNEWWFHARDVPGAHVLVKYSQDILPEQTLREASLLAAHFSKSPEGGPVQYTRVKFVKKPKNSAPGLVSISRERVIDMAIDPELLTKLLKTSGS